MTETKPEPFWARCGDTTPRDWRNIKRVMWAMGAWAVCSVGISQLIKQGVLVAGPLAWMLAVLPSVAAVFVLVTYTRFLREGDELQRVIQLQSLAVGFGGTFFAATGYRIFERLGAPAADAGDLVIVMAAFYTLGSFLSWKQYR
jgi:hypothetical protein